MLMSHTPEPSRWIDPVDPLDPFAGRRLGGRFRLDERIAAGGFGAIYRGTHLSSGRQVAIKVLHPEWSRNPDVVARFRREAAALTSLRHHNTVTTFEAGETPEGTLYIVMELLRGESLYARFCDRGPLPHGEVAAIARQICAALAEAHALGIVHRDLKPANIHLEPCSSGGERVKVLDFGIAKILRGSDLDDGTDLTNAGQMIGTLDYMSPEQILGGACHATSDIYTLGVIMYEVIAGVRPFAEVPGPAMVAALLTTSPPPLASRARVPAALDRIVMRCLAREPHDRYAGVGELADDLARLAAADAQPTSSFTIPAELVARTRPPSQPELLARGSQPALPIRRAIDEPTRHWRTLPVRSSQLPSSVPTFTLDTSTNVWVGRAVWIVVIALVLAILWAARSIVLG
ncbi:MAG: serine/threonine protein kinase [Deltaproteobacteria bacterium]|nr:serine/threonine protein kinase [Deltaproteobacteria bacterium]